MNYQGWEGVLFRKLQAALSACSASKLIPADVVADASRMLHTCEKVTGLTEGQHMYDTEFVLRLCRAVIAADSGNDKGRT